MLKEGKLGKVVVNILRENGGIGWSEEYGGGSMSWVISMVSA